MTLRSRRFWLFHCVFWLVAAFAITVDASSGLPLAGGVLRGLLQGSVGFGLGLGLMRVYDRTNIRDLNLLALFAAATCGGLGFLGTIATNPIVWRLQGIPLSKLRWSYYTYSWLTLGLVLLVWTGFYLANQRGLSFAQGDTDAQAAEAVRSLTRADGYAQYVAVEHRDMISIVPTHRLVAVRAAGDYIELLTDEQAYLRRETLTDMQARLDPERFVRVHRSAIINLDAVRNLIPQGRGDYEVELEGGEKLRVSRRYRSALGERVQMTL